MHPEPSHLFLVLFRMRDTLIAALAVFCVIPASAQTLYLRDGQRGIGASITVGRSDELTSVGGAVTGTVIPGLDVTTEYARIPDDGLTAKAAGLSVVFYPVRTGPARLGVTVGIQRVVGTGYGESTLGSVGVVMGQRIDLTPLLTVVPHVTASLPFVIDNGQRGGGIGFVGSATPAVLIGTGTLRLAVEPSISYGFDTRTTAIGAAIGVVAAL